nr:collagen alpha-1(XI) chain-like [Oncorhynchus nerka]
MLPRVIKWACYLLGLFNISAASVDDEWTDSAGESGSGMLTEVNLLEELSLQVSNSSNASMSLDALRCPVLQVGQYSTLSLPLAQLFTDGFADEFSLLVQLRSPQRDERSVLTLLSHDSHILLQLRISAYTLTFISTQQRHYEFPVSGLSDGQWHHVAVSVSSVRLALYVDCALVESVDWVYQGMGITSEGLLLLGGIIEGFETPFEGQFRQLTFLMGDTDAGHHHCTLHPAQCGGAGFKSPRSPRTNHALEKLLLSSNDLVDLLERSKDSSFLDVQVGKTDVFGQSGSRRGDGTWGPRQKGSVGRGDVFVVDEDTDLADPILQGGHRNPQWKPSSQGPKGSREGKPEPSSKLLEENITTDKKTKDSGGRGIGLFPAKPLDDIIIDLDPGFSPKKPSVEFPHVDKTQIETPLDQEHPDSNLLREEVEWPQTPSQTAFTPTSEPPAPPVEAVTEERRPTTHIPTQPDPDRAITVERGPERPRTVSIVHREGDLVLGSDGQMYRLQRGPPGRMGPPGKEGFPGHAGLRGFKGDRGQLGPEGRAGRQGDPGPPGPPGLPSFYLWKNTIEEWAAFRQTSFYHLLYAGWPREQGPPGPAGEMGKTGPQGPTGDPGQRGPPGIIGEMGEPGQKGVVGRAGLHGKYGENGLDGQSGMPGDPGRQGPFGYRGEGGSKGEKGDEGLIGAKGPRGHIGEVGEKGSLGLPGRPGYVGPPGPQGVRGFTGSEGNPGPDGEAGFDGPPGPPGTVGATGFTGRVGDQGVNGSQGELGPVGVIGPRGPQGPQGLDGESGPPGLRGIQGQPGMSGALGPKGDPGPMGTMGIRGEPGFEGPMGPLGTQGPKGFPGITGKRGPDGDKGDPGPKGERCVQGASGIQGPQGESGPSGFPGFTGLNGQPGTKGIGGENGETGPQGKLGRDGLKGNRGPDGRNGQPGHRGTKGRIGQRGHDGQPGSLGLPGPPGTEGPEGKPGTQVPILYHISIP